MSLIVPASQSTSGVTDSQNKEQYNKIVLIFNTIYNKIVVDCSKV